MILNYRAEGTCRVWLLTVFNTKAQKLNREVQSTMCLLEQSCFVTFANTYAWVCIWSHTHTRVINVMTYKSFWSEENETHSSYSETVSWEFGEGSWGVGSVGVRVWWGRPWISTLHLDWDRALVAHHCACQVTSPGASGYSPVST